MLWGMFAVFLGLWLLAMVMAHTLGGLIHLLLVLAVIVLMVRLLLERRPL